MFAYCQNNPVNYADPSGEFLVFIITVVITCDILMPSQEEHYSRNENNIVPDEDELMSIVEGKNEDWVAVDDKFNKYHRFTNGTQGEEAQYNKKYLSKDGRYEVIICYDPENVSDPYVVTDPNNIGTYNYGPGTGVNHFFKDVLPYYIWKNSVDDTTERWQRIVGN